MKNKQPRTGTQEQPNPERSLPAFDRIYFDAEPLIAEGWPKLSVPLENVASLAKILGITLHLPEVAYLELESVYLAAREAEYNEIVSKIAQLRNRLVGLGGDPVLVLPITDVRAELRDRYLTTVEGLKQVFHPSPVPPLSVQQLLKMANGYEVAFEKGDKGFKDTVIFLSVLEDAKRSPEGSNAVFLSRDGVFRNKREELEKRAKSDGASVVLCATIEEIQDALEHRQTTKIQEKIEEDRKSLETTLSRHLSDIQEWLDANIESFNWQETVGSTYPLPLKFTVSSAKVWRLISVTPQYNPDRVDDGRVRLSFDIAARLLAATEVADPAMRVLAAPRVQPPPSASVVPLTHRKVRFSSVASAALPTLASSERVIEIEAEATLRNGEYSDFDFRSARIKPELMPPMPRP